MSVRPSPVRPVPPIPEPHPIRALLDPSHLEFAAEAAAFAARELAPRESAESDAAARVEARALLLAMGAGGMLDPIHRGDWRACCLAREALAARSPLADAVFALQGLGTLPLLLTGSAAGARLADEAIAGRAMAAFAMTETEAGSD